MGYELESAMDVYLEESPLLREIESPIRSKFKESTLYHQIIRLEVLYLYIYRLDIPLNGEKRYRDGMVVMAYIMISIWLLNLEYLPFAVNISPIRISSTHSVFRQNSNMINTSGIRSPTMR